MTGGLSPLEQAGRRSAVNERLQQTVTKTDCRARLPTCCDDRTGRHGDAAKVKLNAFSSLSQALARSGNVH